VRGAKSWRTYYMPKFVGVLVGLLIKSVCTKGSYTHSTVPYFLLYPTSIDVSRPVDAVGRHIDLRKFDSTEPTNARNLRLVEWLASGWILELGLDRYLFKNGGATLARGGRDIWPSHSRLGASLRRNK